MYTLSASLRETLGGSTAVNAVVDTSSAIESLWDPRTEGSPGGLGGPGGPGGPGDPLRIRWFVSIRNIKSLCSHFFGNLAINITKKVRPLVDLVVAVDG